MPDSTPRPGSTPSPRSSARAGGPTTPRDGIATAVVGAPGTPPRAFAPPAWANPAPGPGSGLVAPGAVPVLLGPPRPPLLDRYWPRPARPAGPAVLGAALGTGLVAALTLWSDRVGLQPALLATGITATAVLAVRGSGSPRPRSVSRIAFTVLAVALAWVPALRDAAPGTVLCIIGALGLAVLAAADGRSWPAVLLAGPAAAVAALRALWWAAARLRGTGRTSHAAAWLRGAAPWLRGAAVALVAGWLFLALLRSADAAFDAAVDAALPQVDLETLPGRTVVLVIFAVLALALAFLSAAPPRWEDVRVPRRPGGVGEWALPLVIVDVLLGAFVAVQAAVLFGAYPQELVSGGLTPAERARQGFGQLVAVTALAVVLLAWAGRRAAPERAARRLLAGLGGGLVALVLVVVASALRRMALYEQAFGWTVLRIHVAAFEVWLAVVLVLCALAWAVRRTDLVARGVVLAAATGLLGLSLASPDALAANANVERFERTGKVDTSYLSRLSADAVPALLRLPEPQRSEALLGREAVEDPWYAENLSRQRAAGLLD